VELGETRKKGDKRMSRFTFISGKRRAFPLLKVAYRRKQSDEKDGPQKMFRKEDKPDGRLASKLRGGPTKRASSDKGFLLGKDVWVMRL